MGRIELGGVVRALLSGAALLSLAACGGGGGVNSASTTPSTSTGSSGSTTTTTPAVNYNDAEYQRSTGTLDAGALAAYNAGATGAGITMAIVDSGIANVGTEFTGRISSASKDFGGSGSVTDTDGHGTAVAATAAAARNGSDIEGVAFGATILALRADTAGSCATTTGCAFNTNTLATAVDYATTNGAKVINMSLGGASATSSLIAAINRATAAGVIIVVSAGNDGASSPNALAQVAGNTAASRGLVIIAGAHDSTGTISSFSDKAGSYGAYYLTALGSGVRAFDNTGQDFLYDGTSFSAPIISGAVALLEQAFPNLTPAQVVALLYSSATDAGATGVDTVYGHGLLNLTKAFAPQGTTSLPGSQIAIASTDQTTTSAAMGDSVQGGASFGRVVVLDELGRAYTMNTSAGFAHENALRPLQQGVANDLRTIDRQLGRLSISSTLAHGWDQDPTVGLALGQRGAQQNIVARPVSGMATLTIDRNTQSAIAFATQGQTLDSRLANDAPVGNYLAAKGPNDTPGFTTQAGMSFAMAHRMGNISLSVTAEQGKVAKLSLTDTSNAPAYAQFGIKARRMIGRLALGLGIATLREDGTVLGAYLAPALGKSGATTRYVDLDARYAIGHGWSLGAAWRQGWTRTDAGGVLQHSTIFSRSAAADLSYAGWRSRFGLRFAMPPKVNGGGFVLLLPTTYDYATGSVGFTPTRIGLTPRGQETDVEASYGFQFIGGWMDTNLYWRRQPANFVVAPDDVGAALRWSVKF